MISTAAVYVCLTPEIGGCQFPCHAPPHHLTSHQPVRGIYVWCPGCAHGGHLDHMRSWFVDHQKTTCPSGCGHVCNAHGTIDKLLGFGNPAIIAASTAAPTANLDSAASVVGASPKALGMAGSLMSRTGGGGGGMTALEGTSREESLDSSRPLENRVSAGEISDGSTGDHRPRASSDQMIY